MVLMVRAEVLTLFECVNRAAIRALGMAGTRHIKVHLGVTVPYLHVGFGAGAIHAALGVEVGGQQFHVK